MIDFQTVRLIKLKPLSNDSVMKMLNIYNVSPHIIIIVWQPILLHLAPRDIIASSHKVFTIHLAADSHHCQTPPSPRCLT